MFDDLRALYQDMILDHGRRPRNFGRPPGADRVGLGYNPSCGDRLKVYLEVDPQQVIKAAGFTGHGCMISIASASLMTEHILGKTQQQAKELFDYLQSVCVKDTPEQAPAIDESTKEDLDVLAGVRQYPIRVKCATLAWHGMLTALENPQPEES